VNPRLDIDGFDLHRPEGFLSLVSSAIAREASPQWWEELVALCNVRFEEAISAGGAEVCAWGAVAVATLDSAAASATGGKARMLQRKAVVQLSLLEYGCVADPDSLCQALLDDATEAGWFLGELGSGVDLVAHGDAVAPEFIAELSGIRQFFRAVLHFMPHIADPNLRSALDDWKLALRI
jgi:hypothetical protein